MTSRIKVQVPKIDLCSGQLRRWGLSLAPLISGDPKLPWDHWGFRSRQTSEERCHRKLHCCTVHGSPIGTCETDTRMPFCEIVYTAQRRCKNAANLQFHRINQRRVLSNAEYFILTKHFLPLSLFPSPPATTTPPLYRPRQQRVTH